MVEQDAYLFSHVLVVPFPISASKNLKVTLFTTLFITESIKVEAKPLVIESCYDTHRSNLSISSAGGKKESGNGVHPTDIFEVAGLKHLPEIIEKYSKSEYPVKCLLFDSICPWVLDISKKFGLIAAAFYTQSCSVNAIYYNIQKGMISIPIEGVTVLAPCLPLPETHEIPSHVYDIDSRPTSLILCLKQFSYVDEIEWHFFNTFDKLENEVMNWMALQSTTKMMAIGPTIPSMYLDNRVERDKDYGLHLYTSDTNACNNWLASKEASSVVYVSFGSLASMGEDQMEEIAWGLRNCNYHFLWVVRSSEESKLPSKFIEETTGKGLVVSWCQQTVVLAHEAVGCFVTHCGWNSTLEGMCLGVPMVAMQQKVDQEDKLEECIKEVMGGDRREEMKRNAVMWKKLAKDAVDIGGSSDKNIEEFVAKISEEAK
ncbi:hypothetical protein MKX01_036615 [Papaver californicum]|nr:hypothetical protein MKX01_036615 [Papaver californicum]